MKQEALKLADSLDLFHTGEVFQESANMIRKLVAELDKQTEIACGITPADMEQLERIEKLTENVKEVNQLSENDIVFLIAKRWGQNINLYDFARDVEQAILKKASEK